MVIEFFSIGTAVVQIRATDGHHPQRQSMAIESPDPLASSLMIGQWAIATSCGNSLILVTVPRTKLPDD